MYRFTIAVLAGAVGTVGCTSAKSFGGPVVGSPDNHCFQLADGGFPGGPMLAQVTQASSCDAGSPAGSDAGPAGSVYGATMFNSGGNDDDCKYLLSWSSDSVAQNDQTTLVVSAVTAADGRPATGAAVNAEIFLPNADPTKTHLSPSLQPPVNEVQPGVYAIGPAVLFDAPGQWVVRFHLHEDCIDELPDSPHGHAAFFVQVP